MNTGAVMEGPTRGRSHWAGLIRLLLVAAVAGMALTARAPEAGGGWRTVFVACALLSGGLVFWAWLQGTASRREVLLIAVLLRVLLLPLPPVLSDDGYRYIWDGMLQAQAGENPYAHRPADPDLARWRDEPVYAPLNSSTYYSVYPPISQLVFALGGLFYPLGWLASWYVIKLVLVGGEVLGLVLLSRMVTPRALLLYAWHPLVLVEGAGQAHTEALAAGLLLLTLWGVRERKNKTAAAALVAAGWVKLYPFVLLPFLWRRVGWRALSVGLGAGAVVALPYAAPYVVPHVRESLDLYVRAFEFNAGPYYVLKGLAYGLTGADWSKQVGPALQLVFLGALGPLYFAEKRWRWSFAATFMAVLAIFMATATTVHPWYLLPVLVLSVLFVEQDRSQWLAWAWAWLGLFSLATYWRYAGPSWGYPAAVTVGWSGWGLLLSVGLVRQGLPALMRHRAHRKWQWIAAHLPGLRPDSRLLDLGAGEGFVGEAAALDRGAEVVLADVVDFNETVLPFVLFDGRRLPFDDDAFDGSLIVFVLHHAEDPEALLREAKRVTRGPIVVVESVFATERQRRRLDRLDRWANALRSEGAMQDQEVHLQFRSAAAWRSAFEALGLTVRSEAHRGRFIHRQALFVLE